jgi:iron-sulfur cluster assembly accessory protein
MRMKDVEVRKEVEATRIPGGERVRLASGTRARLVQSLGGYTLKLPDGGMVRVDEASREALGLEPPKAEVTLSEVAAEKVRRIMEAEAKAGWGIRVSALPSEGGHAYQMDFETRPTGDDRVTVQHGLVLFYAKESEALLKGIHIDYREAGGSAGFVMKPPKRPLVPSMTRGADAPEDSLERRAWDAMRACFDPEIPVNIVELGLVYACRVAEPAKGEYEVEVDMTLTSPGCSVGPVLVEEVRGRLLALPGVKRATVNLVFDPPWHKGLMSEAARLETGL